MSSENQGINQSSLMHQTPIDVTIRLSDGYLSIVDSRGNSIGRWPAVDVDAKSIDETRFLLCMGEENFLFNPEEDEGLLVDLRAEGERSLNGVIESKLEPAASTYPDGTAGSREVDSDGPGPTGESDIEGHGRSSADTSTNDSLPRDVSTEEPKRREQPLVRFADVQRDVVDSIREGMLAWLGFYMRLYEGSGRERLNQAGQGLGNAASQLRRAAGDLEYLAEGGTPHHASVILVYRDAVNDWASGLDLMARGAVGDQQYMAADGFLLLQSGTAKAERVVVKRSKRAGPDVLTESLRTLRKLRPSVRVPRAAVRRAKKPWKEALVAAGSSVAVEEAEIKEDVSASDDLQTNIEERLHLYTASGPDDYVEG